MLAYYKLSGINAIVAMVFNLIILLGFMAYIGAAMTLPGIAGFILTMGMGVDSNVLIFERIKEELAAGRGVRAAVDAGFDRVFLTLLDTHVASLIAAAFLFQFGTGPIRGFATTLTIGLLANLFTSIFVSKTLFEIGAAAPAGNGADAQHLGLRIMQIFKNPNYDFVRWRWHAIALSLIIILAGAFNVCTHGLPLGVDFAGGTIVILKFDQNPTPERVRTALAQLPAGGDAIVQQYGDPANRDVLDPASGAPAKRPAAISVARRTRSSPPFGRRASATSTWWAPRSSDRWSASS